MRINEGVVEDEAEMELVLDKVELEAGDWVKVDVVVFEVGGVIEDREGGGVADLLRNFILEAISWLFGTSIKG